MASAKTSKATAKRASPASTSAGKRLVLSAVCQGLLKSGPTIIDDDALREMFGAVTLRTLPEVARCFGVAHQTAKQWRQSGMPGDPERGYPVLGIVTWAIERNRREAARDDKAADPHRARVREIELRVAELDLRSRERTDAEASLRLVDRHDVVAELCALVTTTRQFLLRLPSKVQPLLPATLEVSVAGEIEGEINRILKYMAEGAGRMVEDEIQLFRELLEERERLREGDTNG